MNILTLRVMKGTKSSGPARSNCDDSTVGVERPVAVTLVPEAYRLESTEASITNRALDVSLAHSMHRLS